MKCASHPEPALGRGTMASVTSGEVPASSAMETPVAWQGATGSSACARRSEWSRFWGSRSAWRAGVRRSSPRGRGLACRASRSRSGTAPTRGVAAIHSSWASGTPATACSRPPTSRCDTSSRPGAGCAPSWPPTAMGTPCSSRSSTPAVSPCRPGAITPRWCSIRPGPRTRPSRWRCRTTRSRRRSSHRPARTRSPPRSGETDGRVPCASRKRSGATWSSPRSRSPTRGPGAGSSSERRLSSPRARSPGGRPSCCPGPSGFRRASTTRS